MIVGPIARTGVGGKGPCRRQAQMRLLDRGVAGGSSEVVLCWVVVVASSIIQRYEAQQKKLSYCECGMWLDPRSGFADTLVFRHTNPCWTGNNIQGSVGIRWPMLELLFPVTIIVGASALWVAGFRLFMSSDLTRGRKLRWTAVLMFVGIGIGIMLPLGQVWSKFLVVLLILPVLAIADVFLFRSRRGATFWIRACGFEVVTVFATAATARLLIDSWDAGALGQFLK
jgi:hypothetical protein